MISLEHLEYYQEVARCESISKAANNLFIERSNLSAIISRLEEDFSTKLFIRTSKGVVLTKEGEQVLDWATRFLGEYKQLKENFGLDDPQSAPVAHLNLFTTISVNEALYTKPISFLLDQYEHLSIHVFTKKVVESFPEVAKTPNTICLYTVNDEILHTLSNYKQLRFIKIIDPQFAAYVPKDHEFAKKYASISFKTLAKASLLLFTANDESPILSYLRSYFSPSTIINTVSSPTMLQQLMETGKYVSIAIAKPYSPPVLSQMDYIPIRDKLPLQFGMVLKNEDVANPIIRSLIRSYFELFKLPIPQEFLD